MCRLLGIRANKPVDLRFSLLEGPRTLGTMSQDNRDGWGLGWYENGKLRVVKEPTPAETSGQFRETSAQGQSQIFIAHVRKATTGKRSTQNCHPFQYNQWLFAHNGSVSRDILLGRLDQQHRSAIQGETDSEVLFHWFLQNIASCHSVLDGLKNALGSIGNYTSLNFLLSDGEVIYAFRDAQQHPDYYSLFYLVRDPLARGPDEFRSDEVGTLLESKRLRDERAVLICSEKLTGEMWEEIPMGHLLSVGNNLIPELAKVRT